MVELKSQLAQQDEELRRLQSECMVLLQVSVGLDGCDVFLQTVLIHHDHRRFARHSHAPLRHAHTPYIACTATVNALLLLLLLL
jgi:hypothetical protein